MVNSETLELAAVIRDSRYRRLFRQRGSNPLAPTIFLPLTFLATCVSTAVPVLHKVPAEVRFCARKAALTAVGNRS